MKRVLLTGMSGTGKSSIIAELRRRGFRAVETDEPGWSVRDAKGYQLWQESRIRTLLDTDQGGPLFISGCAENQVTFYPRFGHIILLTAPSHVIEERLSQRTNNPYGKRPSELAEVLHYLDTVEPLLRRKATHEIDTDMAFESVVGRVLSIVSH
jgi:shikimate kinase